MSKNLRSIVNELKSLFRPKQVNYGKIYDALREMELCTSPLWPDQTQEEWEQKFSLSMSALRRKEGKTMKGLTPMNRLVTLEKLVLELLEMIKKLQAQVTALENERPKKEE